MTTFMLKCLIGVSIANLGFSVWYSWREIKKDRPRPY